jgi:hypothetical protein
MKTTNKVTIVRESNFVKASMIIWQNLDRESRKAILSYKYFSQNDIELISKKNWLELNKQEEMLINKIIIHKISQ